MRRIKVNNKLIRQVNDFNDNLFKGRRFVLPIDNLKKLKKNQKGNGSNARKEYIDKIITKYDDLLNITPSEFDKYIRIFNRIIPRKNMTKKFSEEIIKALRYEDLRKKEFLEILQVIGLKSCVYCNAQLTVVLNLEYHAKGSKKGEIKNRKALLELDHFYPKSQYPFLSTSFFNLLPSCSNCNKAKSTNKARFYIYSLGEELDCFKFRLTKKSIIDYWLNKKSDDIKITFSSKDKALLSNHEKLFKISPIYQTHLDVAEELLHKAKVYSNPYKKNLVTNFKKLFPDSALIDRLIIGNYVNPSDVHKRPLAKFTQDIARQIGLIK